MRVRTESADVVAKWVRSESQFRRELRALRDFAPALGDERSQLLCVGEVARVLVLTHIPGFLAVSTPWGGDPAVHERAGRLTARLHASAAPTRHARYGRAPGLVLRQVGRANRRARQRRQPARGAHGRGDRD